MWEASRSEKYVEGWKDEERRKDILPAGRSHVDIDIDIDVFSRDRLSNAWESSGTRFSVLTER